MKTKKLLLAVMLLVVGGVVGYFATTSFSNQNQGAAVLQGTQSGSVSIGKYPLVTATSVGGKTATATSVMPRLIDPNSAVGKKLASLIVNKGKAPTSTQLSAVASYAAETASSQTANPNLTIICTAQTFCGTGGVNSVYIHCTDGSSQMLTWIGECELD